MAVQRWTRPVSSPLSLSLDLILCVSLYIFLLWPVYICITSPPGSDWQDSRHSLHATPHEGRLPDEPRRREGVLHQDCDCADGPVPDLGLTNCILYAQANALIISFFFYFYVGYFVETPHVTIVHGDSGNAKTYWQNLIEKTLGDLVTSVCVPLFNPFPPLFMLKSILILLI